MGTVNNKKGTGLVDKIVNSVGQESSGKSDNKFFKTILSNLNSGSKNDAAGKSAHAKTSSNTSTLNDSNKGNGFNYGEFEYEDYAENDNVSKAFTTLEDQLGAKPGEYKSTWQGQIDSAIERILNREEFSYDLNSDALYQQYRDQYMQLGKLASADVMGQAAALTGGYGNSYATTAGNQAYQAYLSQLNEVVPELYGMALDRYYKEGEDLYNEYALLAERENQQHALHQEEYNKWLNETQLAYDRYNAERNFDYGSYVDDRNFEYGKHVDDKSFAYNEYRNAIADAQWQQQYEASKAASSSSSGGSIGSGKGDKPALLDNLEEIQNWSDAILSAETINEVQRILPNLEDLDPNLADALYEQWCKDHGYNPAIVDTTVE